MCGRLVNLDTVARVLADYYHLKTDTQLAALNEALSRVPAETVGKELFGISEQLNDTISRQAAIDALMEIMDRPNHAEFLYTDEICKTLNELPSAELEQPPYVAEIETEYQKAVNMPYIKKPLAKALYEVWKKHDREDAERRTDE